ncbi:asparaginase [Thermophilibacter sp.]
MSRVLLIATGGTIASTGGTDGLAPTLTGRELAERVPLLDTLCELDFTQPMNIDSTNMRPSDWTALAGVIANAYDAYDGFVVLHGTDTMAYTAAALSYLIQDSEKPIVLTGSQQPMASPFTDAKLNLYQSVLYACDEGSRDVCVVFGGKVICGTRAHKQRTMSFNAFTSMNYPSLAYVRGDRVVRPEGPAAAPRTGAALRVYRSLDERVAVLKLTPGLRASVLGPLAEACDALVLETFGIGGIPAYDDSWRDAIFDWVDAGRTVVLTTQVPEEGLDLGVYEVGRPYADRPGILRGDDMTTEALVAKTMWALGQTRDPAEVARLFYRPVNHDRTVR